jgi:hypothetical protein
MQHTIVFTTETTKNESENYAYFCKPEDCGISSSFIEEVYTQLYQTKAGFFVLALYTKCGTCLQKKYFKTYNPYTGVLSNFITKRLYSSAFFPLFG